MKEITVNTLRNMDKNTIPRLIDCDFSKQKQNIVITGSTGVGKSFMATAIGYKACTMSYKVMCFSSR